MASSKNKEEQILNLVGSGSAFGDGADGVDEVVGTGSKKNLVHIRIQQRSGRKTVTTVQGIPSQFCLKKIISYFCKKFACNGTVVEHPEYGEVVQLTGDQRQNIAEFLNTVIKIPADNIKKHGF